MAGVTPLFPPKAVSHMSGPCICFKCKHEWVGVMEVGSECVECPSCGCRGVRVGLVSTHVEQEQFKCKCGCFLYRIDPRGPYCIDCGALAVGWF